STDLFGQKEIPRRDQLAALAPLGDLRSVQSSPDRWIAVVSPQEEAEKSGNDAKKDAKKSGPVFRQGYIVRVNMAGHFIFPGIAIEAAVSPSTTLRSEQGSIDVTLDLPNK